MAGWSQLTDWHWSANSWMHIDATSLRRQKLLLTLSLPPAPVRGNPKKHRKVDHHQHVRVDMIYYYHQLYILIYMIFLLYTWLYNAQIGRNISIHTSVYIWYRKKTSNQKRLHRHLITWYVRILELAESSLRSFGSIDSTSAFWFFWIVTPQKDRNNLLLGFYMHDFTFLSF